jgi:hypothetical protein
VAGYGGAIVAAVDNEIMALWLAADRLADCIVKFGIVGAGA